MKHVFRENVPLPKELHDKRRKRPIKNVNRK